MQDPHARQVAALQRLIAQMRERVNFVESSVFWRLRERYFALKARLGFLHDPAPPPIPEREYVETMTPGDPYAAWLLEHEPRRSDLERLAELTPRLAARPRVAIVVDDAPGDASEALEAAAAQVYPHTTVLRTSKSAPDGASPAARFNAALAAFAASEGAGDLERAWVGFVDAGVILAPDATFEAALGAADAEVAVIYSDRDALSADGRRSDPVFVSDFAPDSLLSQPYFGTFAFYRSDLLRELGGLRDVAAHHYDLALRAAETGRRFAHRPRILWHEKRANDAPAWDDLARAVADAAARRGLGIRTERFRDYDGAVIPRFVFANGGRAEIIVPTRDHADDLKLALDGVFALTRGVDYRVTVIDNGSVEPATADLLARYARDHGDRFQTLRVDEPFNFSRLINAGAAATDGPYLVSLNNDTEILDGEWLLKLLEYAQLPHVGAAGARLLYADGTVQHAGVVVGLGMLAGHPYRFASPSDPGPGGALFAVRDYSAVTAAVLATRREAFDRIGGFDERFAVEFNDVDYCLRLGEAGLRSVYLPHVEVRHFESKSRATADTPKKRAHVVRERALFEERWAGSAFVDPFYNPNLTRLDETARFA